MSYSAETLDLSALVAAPLVVVDYEVTLAARKALLEVYWNAARVQDPSLPTFDVLMLETDPAIILTEEFAYAETLILQAINDAAKGLRLAQAVDDDLDHLTVTYHRTQRKLIRAATSTTPAIYEDNEELRSRAQLAPEALADMGLTPGGYVYKVRTAFADVIKHVMPINRGDGHIELRVLGRDGDGTVPGATLVAIANAFRIEDGAQSTDILTVLSGEIVPVVWNVTLVMRKGPDPAAVKAQAAVGLMALASSLHRLGATQYREAIASAAHVGPVITVRVENPVSDIDGSPERAPFVTAINVTAKTPEGEIL